MTPTHSRQSTSRATASAPRAGFAVFAIAPRTPRPPRAPRASFAAIAALAASVLAIAPAATAQSLLATTAKANGQSNLLIVDPATGAVQTYLSVPIPGAANNQLRWITQVPDGRLAGSLWIDNGTANNASQLMMIDLPAGTNTVLNYSAPLNTSYAEGMDYSPRHGRLLISFANFGSFGTNRLALVNLDGTVFSTTNALAGILDLDTVLSSATLDIFFDLNAASNPRVKSMVNPLPATTFAAFASPPLQNDWQDGAIHPTTGDIWFTRPVAGFPQLTRLVGDTYVPGPEIASGGVGIRGLAWAFLPARATISPAAIICPNVPATFTVSPVGTGPFTVEWQYLGGPPPAHVTEWTAITPGDNLAPAGTGAPGRFLFAASGVGTNQLTVSRQTVPLGDPGLPNWSHAGVGQFRFRALVTASVGAAFTSAETTFQLVSDLNFDGQVNTSDLTVFLGRFGLSAPLGSEAARADFNADGAVNTADLTFFLGRFGSACP